MVIYMYFIKGNVYVLYYKYIYIIFKLIHWFSDANVFN